MELGTHSSEVGKDEWQVDDESGNLDIKQYDDLKQPGDQPDAFKNFLELLLREVKPTEI